MKDKGTICTTEQAISHPNPECETFLSSNGLKIGFLKITALEERKDWRKVIKSANFHL